MRLHPYYEMVLETRPVYLYDAGVPNFTQGGNRKARNFSSFKGSNGVEITGTWQGSVTPVSNVRLPRGLHGASRTVAIPSAGGVVYIAPGTVGPITGLGGWCLAGWVYIGSTGRGSLIKVGAAADGISIGIGSGNHEGTGNDVIALYEGVRWIPASWHGLTAGRWHFIALYTTQSRWDQPHLYADGAWRYNDTGNGPKAISHPGRVFSSTAADTVRTLNVPAFAPTFWQYEHPQNKFPFTDTTRALAVLNRLYAAGLKGLYPNPTHRRSLLAAA